MKALRQVESNIIKELGGFSTLPLFHGLVFDDRISSLPSRMLGYTDEKQESGYGTDFSTTFGYIVEGALCLSSQDGEWQIKEGYYFCCIGNFQLKGKGKAVLFERIGTRGVFQIGGPIEKAGRVGYISGCNDSVLVFPPRVGDPCMNCLWIPELVQQTMHIHPTVRYAIIVSGQGKCVTPFGDIPLVSGNVFKLAPMSRHCFFTEDSGMVIVTYHPDSDWGPSDDKHPMLNRTLVHTS